MEFTITPGSLAAAVGYAFKAVPSRPAQAILGGLLITAKNGHLTVSGTDGHGTVSARAQVPADITTEGQTLVPGRTFADIATSDMPADTVRFVLDGSRVRLSAGRANYNVPVMPLSEHPQGLPEPDQKSGTVGTEAFVAAVQQVHVAADPDNALPMLGCVHISFEKDHLTLAATDRYRLAARRIAWEPNGSAAVGASVTVPARELYALVRLMASDGDELTLSLTGDTQLTVAGQSRVASFSTMDGESYPKWQRLIPQSYQVTSTVDAAQANQTLSRVAIVAGRNDPVQLSFDPERIAIQTLRTEDGSAGADEVAATLDGEPLVALFNPQFLKDGLAACGEQAVEICLVSPNKPAVLVPKGDTDFTYLVMTVRPTN